jgi:hypothetical protein
LSDLLNHCQKDGRQNSTLFHLHAFKFVVSNNADKNVCQQQSSVTCDIQKPDGMDVILMVGVSLNKQVYAILHLLIERPSTSSTKNKLDPSPSKTHFRLFASPTVWRCCHRHADGRRSQDDDITKLR